MHSVGPNQARRRRSPAWLLIPLLPVIAGALLLLLLPRPGQNAPDAASQPTIDLPMYAELTLTADQPIALRNPKQNTCWIQPSLWLEDGTLLWRGQLIAPGQTGNPIMPERMPPAGDYENAVLKYECFRMDEEKTPLNGTEARLTLHIQ